MSESAETGLGQAFDRSIVWSQETAYRAEIDALRARLYELEYRAKMYRQRLLAYGDTLVHEALTVSQCI